MRPSGQLLALMPRYHATIVHAVPHASVLLALQMGGQFGMAPNMQGGYAFPGQPAPGSYGQMGYAPAPQAFPGAQMGYGMPQGSYSAPYGQPYGAYPPQFSGNAPGPFPGQNGSSYGAGKQQYGGGGMPPGGGRAGRGAGGGGPGSGGAPGRGAAGGGKQLKGQRGAPGAPGGGFGGQSNGIIDPYAQQQAMFNPGGMDSAWGQPAQASFSADGKAGGGPGGYAPYGGYAQQYDGSGMSTYAPYGQQQAAQGQMPPGAGQPGGHFGSGGGGYGGQPPVWPGQDKQYGKPY